MRVHRCHADCCVFVSQRRWWHAAVCRNSIVNSNPPLFPLPISTPPQARHLYPSTGSPKTAVSNFRSEFHCQSCFLLFLLANFLSGMIVRDWCGWRRALIVELLWTKYVLHRALKEGGGGMESPPRHDDEIAICQKIVLFRGQNWVAGVR